MILAMNIFYTTMVSVKEAKHIISQSFKKIVFKVKETNLLNAYSHILAENIKSLYPSPPFNQSAMDGYALRSIDITQNIKIKLSGENPAGKAKIENLKKGQCIKIFTGAKLPKGADIVIPQEFVKIDAEGNLQFDRIAFSKGDNVRLKGSQFKKGETLLQKNIKLTPASLTTIAMAGHSKVKVYDKPRISIVITGDELIKNSRNLSGDKIIETNSIMLISTLKSLNHNYQQTYYAKDNLKSVINTLQKVAQKADVILISGGISVGKYDFVFSALQQLKAKTLFNKVKQKPGKPLYFGMLAKSFVFGLPGNPAAALTCFYEYVLPVLKRLEGGDTAFLTEKSYPLLGDFGKDVGLAHILKAKITNEGVRILSGQESFKIMAFNEADCFVYLPEENKGVKNGENVVCHIFPKND